MEIKNKTTGLLKLSREIKKWSKEKHHEILKNINNFIDSDETYMSKINIK